MHSENSLRFEPRRCCIVITACTVLHNFGIRHRQWEDELPSGSESSIEVEEGEAELHRGEDVGSRNDISVRHFK